MRRQENTRIRNHPNSRLQRGMAATALAAVGTVGVASCSDSKAIETKPSPSTSATPPMVASQTPTPVETGPSDAEIFAMRTTSGNLPAVTVSLMQSRIPATSRSLFSALRPATIEEFSRQSTPGKIDYANNLVLDVISKGLYKAHPIRGCSWGLNPPVSSRDLAM